LVGTGCRPDGRLAGTADGEVAVAEGTGAGVFTAGHPGRPELEVR
jgi:hypothetical protein